ncbi:hypothetical protein A2U01_0060643, partial [Trifolium medium]|nr:hypothetical protein [Trifolium medium]
QQAVTEDEVVDHQTDMHTSSEEDEEAVRRSTRIRFPSVKLINHEVIPDNIVNNDGDLVHLAFMADTEPVNWKEEVSNSKWRYAMNEEI